MIRKISDFIRMVFISPEALVILICVVINIFWPSFYMRINDWLSESDKWIYLLGVLGGAIGFSVLLAKEILFPSSELNNRILINWPDYPFLKNRVFLSIFICFVAALSLLASWIFKSSLSPALSGLIFTISMSIAFVSLSTLLLATFTIKTLVEGNSK